MGKPSVLRVALESRLEEMSLEIRGLHQQRRDLSSRLEAMIESRDKLKVVLSAKKTGEV